METSRLLSVKMEKFQIIGKNKAELKEWVLAQGLPSYTAGQLMDWVYRKHAVTFDAMTNLSKNTRSLLNDKAEIFLKGPAHSEKSEDGTIKYLFGTTTSDDFVETVYIPDDERATLCVSSQVGCRMGCAFCMTGRMGFRKGLKSYEILNQILSVPEFDKLDNIVFMGMGEPMDNIDEVLRALWCLTSQDGLAWSPKRITVSTIGHMPGLRRFIEESKCHLAISLHTAVPSQRQSWMPSEKAWPVEETVKYLRTIDFSGQRRLSFEYIVFKDMNDDIAHANELIKLLKGIECRVNLIRFHTIPDTPFKSPDEITVRNFAEYLNKKGIRTTIRKSRGEDIKAACGLLSTQGLNK